MGKVTAIEWTDATWNPIRGCSRVSEGCRNCYAESVAARFSGPGQAYEGLASFQIIGQGTPAERVEPHWRGGIRFIEQHLHDPIRWKQPRRIFVNSMSDLFHPRMTGEWLAEIFDVMARAPQHTYQILTKRPERMLDALRAAGDPDVAPAFENTYGQSWPPANWWFGVSIEDQETASHRLPILAQCPIENTFASYEPALGPVNWFETDFADTLEWLICGGESGPHARPMHPDWARAARTFCEFHGIPFFFKQWGAWKPNATGRIRDNSTGHITHMKDSAEMARVGKHRAGALLDGVESKEFPQC